MLSDQIHTCEFWQLRAPRLHIDDKSFLKSVTNLQLTNSEQQQMAALLKEEGYLQSSADFGVDFELMVGTVRSLSSSNLSPVFAFVYDEFWYLFLKLHVLHAALLGGKYFFLPAFWVWNVDPKKNDSGWKPHRDRGRNSLFDDGVPKSLTTWIPLSEATPLNGCIYIVPALHDPIYATAEDLNWKSHLEFQSIRALPAKPGDFFIWNQEVLHWGGRTSSRATESRVSIAFELQRADVPAFVEPLIDPFDIPPFETRLKLIAKLLLRYRNMQTVGTELTQFASALLAV
jgi:hypothetical protein